jgi:hypothetical protein
MMPLRTMVALGAIALFPVLALGAVGASRGWWTRTVPSADTTVIVTAGGTARIGRRGRFTLSLQGPAAVDVPGDDRPIRLEGARAEIANEAHDSPIALEAAGHRIQIAPASTVAVEAPAGGDGLRLTTVAGRPPRVDGVAQVESEAPAQAQPASAGGQPRAPAEATGPEPHNRGPGPVDRPSPAPAAIARPHAARATSHASAPAASDSRPEMPASRGETAPASAGPAASEEVALVRDALERLRGEKDAAAALRLLDDHDQRFPGGLLRDEAAVTRIEALLALDRNREALQRLEMLAPALLDRSPRLQVTRGELRAAHARCSEALDDFAAVAANQPGAEIARRIERGRAACNSAAPGHTGTAGGNR